ncbi:MAG: tRNA glutamyl-Q(34) synthetase GluQRS [Actinomycetaceae bacterium]|nr:tRNA glutamyl-Q(34) synthetase GluQRS [Actinomycetaceae bacterium]
MSGCGRYAPTPSGDLHIGNLRTAVLAWAFARAGGSRFHLRMEDTERVVPGVAERQLRDLASLGIDWDGPVVSQRTRADAHARALETLVGEGLAYECYCTRKDIREAASAPHAQPGRYPGTCRDLTRADRERGRAKLARVGRQPALRLRADGVRWRIRDEIVGEVGGVVDDVVLRRGDGVVAYNLAVVLDDAWAGVTEVCRGDDLVSSALSQDYLADLLGLAPRVRYLHVPLVVNEEGRRLAKRDGAVTLDDLARCGWGVAEVMGAIGRSIGLEGVRHAEDVRDAITPELIRRHCAPWVFVPPVAASGD